LEQYFGQDKIYSDEVFRKRFGVPKIVYHALLDSVSADLCFGSDATGTPSMSPSLAVLCTLRMMRTGLSPDQMDDQVGYSASTIRQRFILVVKTGLRVLRKKHLRMMDSAKVTLC
jgi:hypothetical protein